MPRSKLRPASDRRRLLVLSALLLPLWVLLLVQSVETTWSFTQHRFPMARVGRYEPLRAGLGGALQADLYVSRRPAAQRRAFWFAQYALTPTVLTLRPTPETVLRRATRADPYVLVVEFPSHREFARFASKLQRVARREERTVRVHDLGNGMGVLVARTRGT